MATAKKQIRFITSNAGKLAEVQRALSLVPSTFDFVQAEANVPEFQGEPPFVAEEKCIYAAKQVTDGPVVVEDTSLCFKALGDLPGVYVKWFLEKTGRKGLVNMLAAYEDKTAYAQCIFALTAGPGYPVHCFIGKTYGKIVDPRGPMESFGWDPIFEPDEGKGKTFAEMTKDEKNSISHRGRALKELCEFLKTWEPEKELPMIKKQKTMS